MAQNFTISGYVKDSRNGESAIGANVYVKELMKGASTNVYGFYSLTLPAGTYTLQCSYVGFQTFSKVIELNKNLSEQISLLPEETTLNEVEVVSEKTDQNVQSTQMSSVQLDVAQIKKLPAFMGEVDILKTIQLIPGVKSAGDGNTGFYVRGGGPDQNLILLDEATIYNASHLMGFFSIFNGDAIKNVNLIKGGMPSQYGGRLSSVLDVSMKEGNSQKFQVDGGIGIIASRLTIQGPIKKDKASFIISARRTYADVIAKPFMKHTDFAGTSYYFYDLNAKLNYQINDKNRLFLSAYFGRDIFKYNNDGFTAKIPWGNATACLRWNHLFNAKLFSNLSVVYSKYDFSFTAAQDNFELTLFSGIKDWNVKYDVNYFPNTRHNVKVGVNYIFHTFTPSNVSAKQGEVKFDIGRVIRLYSHDAAIYVSDDWEVTDRIKVNAGLRFGYFAQVGPFTRYKKNDFGKTIDTVVYAPGKKVADYNGLEPRLSFRYSLSRTLSLKASYTRNFQYIHLASISSVSLPTDVWMPCTELIKPQIGNQYAFGVFKNFNHDMFESSVEVYYKDMKNQIDYKEGAEPQDNVFDNPDNAFTYGKGWAYGAEFFLKKRTGKFTGWIGYTLSWTWRQFDAINYGKKYLAKYDRRHDASVVITYDHNKKWNFGLIWVYGTGNRGTLPSALFAYEGSVSNDYGLRNSYKFPDYHRLDLSVTYTPDREKQIEKKRARITRRYERRGKDMSNINLPKWWAKNYQSSWTLSIFNAYNRYNPYFIYFDTSGDFLSGTFTVKAKQVSLFPVLPTITWNFKF
ncbi:MAG: TonB-dependent receptor [Bacteroidetes bacterium]|nr:TonB-dependent receptor [Bacteroidota bacterium]